MDTQRICIYYFSGTGMTEYIVNKLYAAFTEQGAGVDCVRIEDREALRTPPDKYDMIGIAYPVHSLNAPRIVIDFAGKLEKSNGRRAFIICTMGEDHPVNRASSDLLIKVLKNKGFNVFFHESFEMPSNFISKYNDAKVSSIIEEANRRVPATVRGILNGEETLPSSSQAVKALTVIARAEWFGANIIGKLFYAGITCKRCGQCISVCPNKNIRMKKHAITFGWNCGLCMRCVYLCESCAIKVRVPFWFIHIGSWYDPKLFE